MPATFFFPNFVRTKMKVMSVSMLNKKNPHAWVRHMSTCLLRILYECLIDSCMSLCWPTSLPVEEMKQLKDMDYINSTYWHMFSFSHLNVFLDKKPTGNHFTWKLKRFQNYFFMMFYFPFFLSMDIAGFMLGREADLPQIAFDISYMSHLVQVLIKMSYYMYFIKEIRELCLNFEDFHFSRHRPTLSKYMLSKKSDFLRRLADRYYKVIYMNLMFWSVSPLLIQPTVYILTKTGVISGGAHTIIPKFFPVRYPFDETATLNRIFIAFMEIIVLTAGFIYFIPIDQFFVSVIIMMCGAMDVLCTWIRTTYELRSEEWKNYGRAIGQEDDKARINIKLFIEDHQHALK